MTGEPREPARGLLDEVLSRPVSVSIAALALVVLGGFSLWRLPMSLLPTLERPRLEVMLRDDDRSREELLLHVVEPLERRLRSLDGVLDVFSTVDDGEATVTLETEWRTSVDRLRIDAERRLADVSSAGLDELTVRVEAGDDRPILQVAVLGGALGDEGAPRRTAFAERVLLPTLGRLPGAGETRLVGGAVRRVVVRPRAAALAARSLAPADLAARLETLGRGRPLGRVRAGDAVRPLLLRPDLGTLEALGAARVADSSELRLRDVADLDIEVIPDGGLARVDGRAAVLVEVYRAPGANAVILAREGRLALAELASRAAPLELRLVRDRSREVVESLSQLARAALLGLALGTFVLRALLGAWRPTFALVVVVPVSIVSAFSAFYLFDVSLDLVALAGLALAAGMLVDNSIVVLEAIASAREAGARDPVVQGTREIAGALVASFLTTAVVFLPLVYLQGLAQAFFGVQAFAIVSTLLLSLVVSLSLTPVLARRFGEGRTLADGGTRGRQPGRGTYLRLLDAGLARPWPWLVVTALVLTASVFVLLELPRELLPAGTSRTLAVDLRLPSGTDVREAERRLDSLLRGVDPESLGVGSSLLVYRGDAGATGASGRSAGRSVGDRSQRSHAGELELFFPDVDRLEAALDPVAQIAARQPGVETDLETRRGAVAEAVATAGRRPRVEVSATTPERLAVLADAVVAPLEAEGFRVLPVDSGSRAADAGPALVLDWDDLRLAELGASSVDLARQVSEGLGGFVAGRTSLEGVEPELFFDPARVDDLGRLGVRAGERVLPLAAVAAIETTRREPPLVRRNGRPTALFEVEGARPADLEARLVAPGVELGPGESVRLAGETLELRRAFAQLRFALVLALALVFLVVAALYESLRLPLVVLVTVPTAAAGASFALALTGQSLNVMSFLGLILLTGIVVNNALVLLHRVEQQRRDRPVLDALRAAAAERYRPILATTLTTLLGMLPLALLGGEGVELRRALAVAVSGGLATSWAASLVVVPLLYRALVPDDPALDDRRAAA